MRSDKSETVTFTKRPISLGKIALGAVLMFGVSGVAAAQNMVVRSVGPSASSYPAGKKLADNARISLKKMDRITILSKSGTRILKGPGIFSLGSRAGTRSSTSTRLSSFISNRGSRRGRPGAVRGAGSEQAVETPENPNLWFLDVRNGGKFCVANANTLVIWRPDYTGSATASIVEPANGNVTQISWRNGNPLKAWPKAEAPINNNARYRLIGSNVEKSVEVNFVILDSAPEDIDEAAAVLIKNGCQSQLDLLVDTLNSGTNTTQNES